MGRDESPSHCKTQEKLEYKPLSGRGLIKAATMGNSNYLVLKKSKTVEKRSQGLLQTGEQGVNKKGTGRTEGRETIWEILTEAAGHSTDLQEAQCQLQTAL